MNQIQKAACDYARSGLSIIPTSKNKKPTIDEWTPYQQQIASEAEIKKWFSSNTQNIAVICGKISGNLEIIDFDFEAEAFKEWATQVHEQDPHLLLKLIIEKSPHGTHIAYRCLEASIPGNTKLAKAGIGVSGPGYYLYVGRHSGVDKIEDPKKHKGKAPLGSVNVDGKWFIVPCLIETRGEGGYCLVYPSKGYELKQGDFRNVPVITAAERDILIESARVCNTWIPPQEIKRGYTERQATNSSGKLPGQDYDERGDIRALLEKHGWTFKGNGNDGRERWARPGKEKGHSATLTDGKIFYPFSSNSHPFESGRAYGPFSVFAVLEHGGDFSAAAKALAAEGYGSKPKKEERKARLVCLEELECQFSERVEWLYRDIIPKRMPIMWSAREGEGKTTNIVQIGQEVLNENPQGIIIGIPCEGFVEDMKDKLAKLNVDKRRFPLLQNSNGTYRFNFALNEDLKQLQEILQECKDGKLPVLAVIIDSIRGMTTYDDNDSRIRNVMMNINAIVCEGAGASLIYLHHFKKSNADSLLDKNVGATALTAAVRGVYSLIPQGKNVRKIIATKMNILGHHPKPLLSIEVQDGDRYQVIIREENEGSDDSMKDKAQEWLTKMFTEKSSYKAADIYQEGEKQGFSSSTLKQAKADLPITVTKSKGKKAPWLWVCTFFRDQTKTGNVPYDPFNDNNNLDGAGKGQGTQGIEGIQGILEDKDNTPNKTSNNNQCLHSSNKQESFFLSMSEESEEIPEEGLAF
ncbi:MAG: bifunctional DNA primase/polymerase [Pseudomonadota bacterium]